MIELKKLKNRLCILCDEYKLEDQFTPTGYKDGGFAHLRDHICDKCKGKSKKDNHIDFSKSVNQTNRFKYRDMTDAKYNILFNLQEGKCKICERHQSKFKKRLCVDHDHDTDDVRGLLCGQCNSAIGLFKDNINSLKNAISYIKDSKIPLTPEQLKAIKFEELRLEMSKKH